MAVLARVFIAASLASRPVLQKKLGGQADSSHSWRELLRQAARGNRFWNCGSLADLLGQRRHLASGGGMAERV